jgi:uncharacterized membrane-anchored protein YhcB (DUF1043 family)
LFFFFFSSAKSAFITSFQLLAQNTTTPTLAVGTLEHGLFLRHRGKWNHFTETNRLASNIIYSIAALKDKFYAATGKGLVLKEWSEEKYFHDQQIRYTNLPPGRYRIQLKAKNALGAWSAEVTSPAIIIPKPLHRQWWFYPLVFLLAGIVFYGIFQLVSGKRRASALERKVQERTSQLQEVEKQYRSLFEESKDMEPPFMWFCPNLEEK